MTFKGFNPSALGAIGFNRDTDASGAQTPSRTVVADGVAE
jgi:hypothetical protein